MGGDLLCNFFQLIVVWGLDNKVNKFLKRHPDIEVIDIKYIASVGSIYAAILY